MGSDHTLALYRASCAVLAICWIVAMGVVGAQLREYGARATAFAALHPIEVSP